MPNDAKLGLVVGVVLVIAIAVVYFRSDGSPKVEETPAATGYKPATAARQHPARGQVRPTKARPAVQSEDGQQATSELCRHTVAEGETLEALAERYYGDQAKADAIYRVNRDQIKGAEPLQAGTVLIIPTLGESSRPETDHRP
jgi:nucleoid-associated protein YgaU